MLWGEDDMRWQHYQVMTSVQETIDCLAQASGLARVVAGGTDLIVQIMEMDAEEESLSLLDISRIKEMQGILESNSCIVIGAATTMAELCDSRVIRTNARALAQGAGWLGAPQIRNVATIGGNVVNAMPAADTSVPLVALGAEAHIVSPDGERDVAVEELFLGVGKSVVNPSREVITQFRVPVCRAPTRASAMQRLSKRKAFTLPQLSIAVRVELDDNKEYFKQVRIAAAPLAFTPLRMKRAEEVLAETPVTLENVKKAAVLAWEEARPRDSLRAGSEYRKDMVEVLTRRALSDALNQLEVVFENE